MNLLHFIIFTVVSYYCAYVLDFVFLLTVVNYCGRTPLGALIKSLFILTPLLNISIYFVLYSWLPHSLFKIPLIFP